jgi:hypothetical protein
LVCKLTYVPAGRKGTFISKFENARPALELE